MHLFPWSEVNLVSHDHLVFSRIHWISNHNSQNYKKLISQLYDIWSKKQAHFAFSNFQSWRKEGALRFQFGCIFTKLWIFWDFAYLALSRENFPTSDEVWRGKKIDGKKYFYLHLNTQPQVFPIGPSHFWYKPPPPIGSYLWSFWCNIGKLGGSLIIFGGILGELVGSLG